MDPLDPPVFGVDTSFSGKRWSQRPFHARLALGLAQQHDLPEIVGRLISARGISTEEVTAYLDPKLSTCLPDPLHLLDMSAAVDRLVAAVRGKQSISVFGDYDVDGATSSALLKRYFRALGLDIRVYIPDRQKEGYGPTIPALDQLKSEGADVVITVDCGIASFKALSHAKAAGLDVVVLDHHVAEASLPEAVAIVNPNRLDETSVCGQLAAVGVTFLFLVALNRGLRDAGYFLGAGLKEPNLMQWLDLVALGTVADVVPLTGVNRALVAQGIKVMARRHNEGIKALSDVANLDELPAAYHLGFIFGPRLNAGGRVGEAGLGSRLLSTTDKGEAARLAQQLDVHNQDRREIEERIQEDAMVQAKSQGNRSVIMVSAEGWNPGVVGIVASRLKEHYNLPACVVALADGKATGSGRSIAGLDLGNAVIAARQQGLIRAGGGHAMAAGFSLDADKLGDFHDFLDERAGAVIREQKIVPTATVDGVLSIGASTPELIQSVQCLGPFGSGNAEPRFAYSGLRVVNVSVVGRGHVRCVFSNEGGARLQAISFRSAETTLGQHLLNHGGQPLHVLGRLRENVWQGRSSVQLHIDDAALASAQPQA